MGIADRIKQRLNRRPSVNQLVTPDPTSKDGIYAGGPKLGAIPESDGGAGSYYHPSSPSSPLPNPQQRPILGNINSSSSSSSNNNNSSNAFGNFINYPHSRESLSPLTASSSSTKTYETQDTRYSFGSSGSIPGNNLNANNNNNNKSPNGFPPAPQFNGNGNGYANAHFPKPDPHLSGHSTTGGDYSDPKASNAEVQRCIRLLRQLFELRIKIWGMRRAHWSTQGRRTEAKRQARDLYGDISQIVSEWNSMPRSTWTVEEYQLIFAIGNELQNLAPFWDERVEVDSLG